LPPARLRIEVHQCSLLVRDAEPPHARRDLRAPGDLGRREHGAGISVITAASRFEDIDASLRLLRHHDPDQVPEKPIRYGVSVHRKTDARPGHTQ
jgi:hypothetical protein